LVVVVVDEQRLRPSMAIVFSSAVALTLELPTERRSHRRVLIVPFAVPAGPRP
jgi:hypothetical protein